MPPKTPQSNYSKRPVRRLRLPKIVPPKTKGLFEEYFYPILVVIFVVVAILGKAGGLSGFNALVVGAWLAVFIWFVGQLKGYLAEKSKVASGKTAEPAAKAPVQEAKEPPPLPPWMKPMIGPQWPLKTGPWPARPRQTTVPPTQAPAAPRNANKPGFVYERPTLPDRKPKLPNNWRPGQGKKPKR
jgi:hypothetical protein